MRLLVSVRSAAEVRAVLDGGADIVDAKEPSRGPLGPVEPAVLQAIAAAVPPSTPLSVALGDPGVHDAARAVLGVPKLPARAAPLYLKVGFAGVANLGRIEAVLAGVVAAAAERGDGSAVVPVVYADHERAGTAAPLDVARAAAAGGAAGVLVDTWGKDGRDLLEWMPGAALDAWVAWGRAAGLLTAVAGSLRGVRLEAAASAGADIIGVRAAVCEGGRDGVVQEHLVRDVARALRRGRRSPAGAM